MKIKWAMDTNNNEIYLSLDDLILYFNQWIDEYSNDSVKDLSKAYDTNTCIDVHDLIRELENQKEGVLKDVIR